MKEDSQRIVSLLPSTTEIICALGRKSNLVGRSHECDYPASVTNLPVCTEPKFEPDGTSYQIDRRIKALLENGLSVYRVDADVLSALNPDVIITQDHCEVCAASLHEVRQAVQEFLDDDVSIISVSPNNLNGVFNAIREIAGALGTESEGEEVIAQMQSGFEQISKKTAGRPTKNICCLEWMDPLMAAGNWVPELVDIAGGRELGAVAGKHSPVLEWGNLLELNPEILAVVPCGYSIDQTLSDMNTLTDQKEWKQLDAVRYEKVYILDGNQFFNRPGPRLTDSAEIFAEILHPDIFKATHLNDGWIPYSH
ncbi:cobalamin-binding protein [Balneolaceae bacterium YR4-1]|uniref:Cobalamin-binding protein n=1 Tax=Halalkalibaculum roseum TaxID=2709311 RepID=A0A6M1T3X6_9BACT|nr:cobalamin-binding protein [Halalkalibaculum roseum]NGP77447.1 cobalamin-binding protein [Halalkalibaculum roseum]